MDGLAAAALFAILTAIVVWPGVSIFTALAAYLVLMHVDMAPTGWTAATAIGGANAVKIVVLPTWLIMRTRMNAAQVLLGVRGMWVWAALSTVAAVAVLWSPFPVAAIKQLGYMYSFAATIGLVVWAMREDPDRTTRIVLGVAVVVVAIALVRSFVLVDTGRLSSFSPVQGFGLYLVLMIVFVFGAMQRRAISGYLGTVFALVLLVCVFLNGTRTGFGMTAIFMVYAVAGWSLFRGGTLRARSMRTAAIVMLVVGTGVAATTASIIAPTRVLRAIEGSRALRTVSVAVGDQSLEDIGTLAWRFGMYSRMISDIGGRGLVPTVIGRGTSSTASIITSGDYYYRTYTSETVDPNRIAHNEFLRAFYEWGLIGGSVFLLLIAFAFGAAWRAFRRDNDFDAYCILGGFGVVFAYLAVENLLAAAGTAAGAGVVVLVAWLIVQFDPKPEQQLT